MPEPSIAALISALDNSVKVASTPLFATVIDRILGFKLSQWTAEGDTIKKQILDGYEEAKQKGLGLQYVSAFRANTNLINISAKASKYISAQVKEDIKIDNDVFWGLIEHSKSISNEEMQEFLAKILAGEYNSPGAYSMSTLQIIKSLGKGELVKFSTIGEVYLPGFGFLRSFFSSEKEVSEVRQTMHLNYKDFLELQNLGLIHSGSYTSLVSFQKDKVFSMEYGNRSFLIKILEDKTGWSFPECYELTTAGKQIMQHLDRKESPVFWQWLKGYLEKEGIKILD